MSDFDRSGSRADNHDREKLEKWSQGLEREQSGSFPVCAIFLVSESDWWAHDSFREFRGSFESRNSEFHHVVIFGQHGVSTTVKGFLTELDLSPTKLPFLLIVAGGTGKCGFVFDLPSGNDDAPTSPEELLRQLERLIDGKEVRQLGMLAGGTARDFEGQTLAQLASSLLSRV